MQPSNNEILNDILLEVQKIRVMVEARLPTAAEFRNAVKFIETLGALPKKVELAATVKPIKGPTQRHVFVAPHCECATPALSAINSGCEDCGKPFRSVKIKCQVCGDELSTSRGDYACSKLWDLCGAWPAMTEAGIACHFGYDREHAVTRWEIKR